MTELARGPWIYSMLRHLRSAGFDLAPEPLGIDECGREILSFIEDQDALRPWPAVLRRDEGLRQVAGMLLKLQNALPTFAEPADAIWHGGSRSAPEHVIRHGDLAPWNTLWVEDRLTGLIDWDTAEPAPAGWDATQGARYFIPLRPPARHRCEGTTMNLADVRHRLRVWCDLRLTSLTACHSRGATADEHGLVTMEDGYARVPITGPGGS